MATTTTLSTLPPSARIAVYSGTFDPLTKGHEDIIQRALMFFDALVIAVAVAHHKKPLFSLQERITLVEQSVLALCPDKGRVRVMPFDGLVVHFCQSVKAQIIVRGVRNGSDFDYEMQMAAMNRKLDATIDTVILMAEGNHSPISSTLVREISQLGGNVSGMVNPIVLQALERVRA